MSVAHLSSGGVSLVLASDVAGIPYVVHWGAPLGDLDDDALTALVAARRPGVARSSYDAPRTTGLVPDGTRGFAGTPALQGHRVGGDAGAAAPSLVDWETSVGDSALTCTSSDAEAGWEVTVQLGLDDGEGLQGFGPAFDTSELDEINAGFGPAGGSFDDIGGLEDENDR